MSSLTSLLVAAVTAVSPVPKVPPMLTCEVVLNAKAVGDPSKYPAEVVITNNSVAPIVITWTLDPLQNLELEVTGPQGFKLKTDPYAGRFSPDSYPPVEHHLTIKAGESYRAAVGLLTTVSPEDIRAGTYKVRAVYSYKGKTYPSKEVSVTIRVN